MQRDRTFLVLFEQIRKQFIHAFFQRGWLGCIDPTFNVFPWKNLIMSDLVIERSSQWHFVQFVDQDMSYLLICRPLLHNEEDLHRAQILSDPQCVVDGYYYYYYYFQKQLLLVENRIWVIIMHKKDEKILEEILTTEWTIVSTSKRIHGNIKEKNQNLESAGSKDVTKLKKIATKNGITNQVRQRRNMFQGILNTQVSLE